MMAAGDGACAAIREREILLAVMRAAWRHETEYWRRVAKALDNSGRH